MKTKFKTIALSAATILTLTFASQSLAALTPFTDLANVTAKDKIISLQNGGYIHGVTDELFVPNATITAAQGVQLIVNALGLNLDLVRFAKEPKATDYYANANDSAWYANALITAAVNNVELPKDLDPSKSWTREEFTHYLIRTIETHSNLPMIKLNPVAITDDSKITIDYSGSIQRALSYKVVTLDAKGNINPKAKISRAEAAEQIFNALEYIKAHPAPTPAPEAAE